MKAWTLFFTLTLSLIGTAYAQSDQGELWIGGGGGIDFNLGGVPELCVQGEIFKLKVDQKSTFPIVPPNYNIQGISVSINVFGEEDNPSPNATINYKRNLPYFGLDYIFVEAGVNINSIDIDGVQIGQNLGATLCIMERAGKDKMYKFDLGYQVQNANFTEFKLNHHINARFLVFLSSK